MSMTAHSECRSYVILMSRQMSAALNRAFLNLLPPITEHTIFTGINYFVCLKWAFLVWDIWENFI